MLKTTSCIGGCSQPMSTPLLLVPWPNKAFRVFRPFWLWCLQRKEQAVKSWSVSSQRKLIENNLVVTVTPSSLLALHWTFPWLFVVRCLINIAIGVTKLRSVFCWRSFRSMPSCSSLIVSNSQNSGWWFRAPLHGEVPLWLPLQRTKRKNLWFH